MCPKTWADIPRMGRKTAARAEPLTEQPPWSQLGGLAKRERPDYGLRPTWLFAFAFSLAVAYVALAVYLSDPWRSDLDAAIGPIASWLIPALLAYIPALVIGLLAFTLILLRYRFPVVRPPSGPWTPGVWPPVTVVVAAWNEEDAIVPTLEGIAGLSYPGPVEVVLADNNSTDGTAQLGEQAARRLDLRYRRVFEPETGKYRALNAALGTVTTPLVVTRRRRYPPAPRRARLPDRPRRKPPAGSARVCVRRCAHPCELSGQLPLQDAGLGLPPRHQRDQAHAVGI